MIRIIAIATTLVIATPAIAQQSSAPKIPTGYEVPGCTHYVLKDGQVVQRCNLLTPAEIAKAMTEADHPRNAGSALSASAD